MRNHCYGAALAQLSTYCAIFFFPWLQLQIPSCGFAFRRHLNWKNVFSQLFEDTLLPKRLTIQSNSIKRHTNEVVFHRASQLHLNMLCTALNLQKFWTTRFIRSFQKNSWGRTNGRNGLKHHQKRKEERSERDTRTVKPLHANYSLSTFHFVSFFTIIFRTQAVCKGFGAHACNLCIFIEPLLTFDDFFFKNQWTHWSNERSQPVGLMSTILICLSSLHVRLCFLILAASCPPIKASKNTS